MQMTTAQALSLATHYHASGQLEAAEQLYAAILQAEPHHAEVLHALGLMAVQRRDLPAALDFLRRATACVGASAAHWNNLGVVLIQVGNPGDAVAALEHALQLWPNYAEAYNNLGVAWRQQGELTRATACHREAIRCWPTYAEAYDNLGTDLRAQGEREEAVAAHQQAVTLRPDFAAAFNNLGIALQEQQDYARAIESYQRALQLQPGDADASNNLASALKEQGLLDAALAQYRETLRLQPDHALAYYNLSQFAAEQRYCFSAIELQRLRDLLTAGRGSNLERSLFCFTLATVLDREGATDAAFRYYAHANDLRRQMLQQVGQAFDARHHQAGVEQVLAGFGADYFPRVRSWGIETDLPVFIVGMPRSGTTLLEHILASHPAVFGAGERGDLTRLLAAGAPSPYPSPVPDAARARGVANQFLQRLTRLGGAARRVIVKAHGDCLYLGVIATLFPRARILHCRREPLDVGLSCYMQNFEHLTFAWSLEDIGAYYRQYERLMAHWQQFLPVPIHEIRYEELLQQPEAVIRAALAYCGLDWDARCLRFHENQRAVATASTVQVRKPLSAHALGRWQRYRAHLEPLRRALGQPDEDGPKG